jgi:hypothetical protein
MFRLGVHQANGQAYEDLFVNIMRYENPDFRPVKAYGNVGDKKNDGYNHAVGAYYQVYAPDDIRLNQGDALKKLKDDFKGLLEYWGGFGDVRSYFFVINDKYRGVSPDIEKELATIRVEHGLEDCMPILAQHLEDRLFALDSDKIIAVVGHVPMLEAGEFLFLSGFTYFFGAWIEFERSVRALQRRDGEKMAPVMFALGRLRAMQVFSDEEVQEIHELRRKRNDLVHGEGVEIPEKAKIDWLVEITTRLRA